MTYDEWLFDAPEDPEPCDKCDDENCTCAQDEEDERGDALFHQRQDNGRPGQ